MLVVFTSIFNTEEQKYEEMTVSYERPCTVDIVSASQVKKTLRFFPEYLTGILANPKGSYFVINEVGSPNTAEYFAHNCFPVDNGMFSSHLSTYDY